MHSIFRVLGSVALAAVLLLSCTDADDPFSPGRPFQVQLAPRYAESAVFIGSEPITEIRLTVKNASTEEVIQVETRVASEVETPDGSAWEVALEVTPPSDGSDVTILMELLNAAGETEWSGEAGPIAVSSGSSSVVEDVEIFPGPPANLSVEAVEITTAPATLLEGDTSRLAASLTGGEEGARVVWSALTPDLASVDDEGLATALLPGTARVQAAAGPAADTVEVEIAARVPDLRAAALTVDGLAGDTLVEGDTLRIAVEVANDGTGDAGATSLALRALDAAALGAVVADTLHPQAAIASGQLLHDTVVVVADDLTGWPDSVVFELETDPADQVAESDETNNALRSGVVRIRRSVASVVVSPAADTLTSVGGTAQFTAEARDADGAALAGRSFTWSSSDAAVATVDGAGLATAVDFGTALIQATVEGVVGSGELAVERPPPPAGFTKEWIGADPASPTSWGAAANWNPAGVPASTDTVLVASTVATQPVLDGSYAVGGLTVETGASVDLASFTLTASGSVDAGQTIVGSGTLVMSGVGATLSGTVPSLTVTGDVALSGATSATGVVHVSGSGAILRVGTQTLTVSDSLLTSSSGVLSMIDPAANVQVANGARFAGGDTRTTLTAGTLQVGGSFTEAGGGSIYAFSASGGHTTLLDGSAAQAVSFANPPTSHFHNLEVTNATSAVSFATQTEATGNFALRSGGVVPAGDLRVGGDVFTEPSTSLTLTRLHVGGVMNIQVQDAYDVGTTRYTGTAAQTVQPGLPYQALEIRGDVALGGAVATSGPVTVSGVGVNLAVNGQTLSVGDSLFVTASGILTMTNGADLVQVTDGARFGGGDTRTTLTAGTLRVRGAFTQVNAGTIYSFAASGAHTTILDGAAPQTVSFTDPTASHFHALDVTNASAGGVSITGVAAATGAFVLAPSAVTSGTGTLEVTGSVTTGAGSSLGMGVLAVGGVLTHGGADWSAGTTRFTGGPAQIVPTIPTYDSVEITGDAVLGGDVSTAGTLQVLGMGADLDIGGHTLTVAGDFVTADGGVFTMDAPSDTVLAQGQALFDGGATSGHLTDGTLLLTGSAFEVPSGHGYQPTGSHVTELAGTFQLISFASPGTGGTESWFRHLLVTSTSGGVNLSGTALVTGDFTVAAGAIVDSGSGTLITGGQVTTGLSSAVTLQALELVDDTMSIGGSYSVGTTVFAAAPDGLNPQILQSGLPYQDVLVKSVARYTDACGGVETISGALTVSGTGAVFTPGFYLTLTVQGDLVTELGGILEMLPPAVPIDCSSGTFTVDGSVTFGGGSTDGRLTSGTLAVGGDFTETAPDAFLASGGHTTVLSGTGTVTFADTQPSHFQNLTVSGTVDVPETAWVGGGFFLTGGGSLTGAGQIGVDGNLTTDAGTTLGVGLVRVTGTLSVQGTYSVGRIIFSGGTQAVRQEIQADLPYQNVTVEQFAQFAFGAAQSITGNLVVESTGDFTPGACVAVTVGGDLDVIGTLTMGNPECPDEIDVSGNAIFRGGDTGATLTDGTLRVAGDLTQTGTSSTASFSPSGLHQVVLNGAGAQTISFDNPGTTTSHFNDLEILNGARTITLATDVFVTGTLTTSAGATLSSSGATLNTNDVNVNGMTLDNVLFELVNPSVGTFDNVIFSENYSTTDTQFLVRHPGSLTAFAFTGLTFRTIPSSDTGQGFYLVAEDTSADQVRLTVELFSPDPASPGAGTTDTLGEAIITWPAP